jgi:hypothetical protein
MGGKTELMCREALKAGKLVWTVSDPANGNLKALGARVAAAGQASEILNAEQKGLAASSQLGD